MDEWLSLRSAKPSTAVRIRQAPPKIEQSQKAALFLFTFANPPFPFADRYWSQASSSQRTKPPLNVEHVISRDVHKSERVGGDTKLSINFFGPEAFNLENGDRLIALIEKLPGVSTKDGKLL